MTRKKPKRRRKSRRRPTRRTSARPRKLAAPRKKPQQGRKRPRSSPLIELAVREMNRGRSLAATARSLKLLPEDLRKTLKQRRLLKRKGKRWVINDDRPRRVPVMTGGRRRNLTVRGFEQASLLGEYHHAVGEFLQTNDIRFLKPFKDLSVQAATGRRYVLETDPNALHRIAAMDTPPFHEIYEITSNT